MYHPTTRVLTVLELLQSYPQLTGAQLTKRLEVDVRTARRYVAMLQEDMGVPVEAVRGRHGGYRLRPGFKLPPLMFSEEEAVALTLGLLTARRLGLAGAAPAVEGALAKVERVLPGPLQERVQALDETLAVAGAFPAYPPSEATTLAALALAARQRRRVRLTYTSGGALRVTGFTTLTAWCSPAGVGSSRATVTSGMTCGCSDSIVSTRLSCARKRLSGLRSSIA